MLAYEGFKVGDYVIVTNSEDDWSGYTFKITKLSHNMLGAELIRVVDITRPGSSGTSFYPHELSYEDGTRPAPVNRVNRGAY